MDIIAYEIYGGVYINLTNKCSCDCDFCERNRVKADGDSLWLEHEPSVEQVIAELEKIDLSEIGEIVFCGWGEPTYRWDAIKEISDYIHSIGKTTRLNTNGHGSLINGYDITQEIAKYIDKVSISLNNSTRERYQAVCHSMYGEKSFDELIDFASKCNKAGVHTTLSVVDCIGETEIAEAREIAESIGVHFRVRPEIK